MSFELPTLPVGQVLDVVRAPEVVLSHRGPEVDPAGKSPWPAWVYGVGQEPDFRFSLANERTALACHGFRRAGERGT